jgi:hypothetical protein
MYKSKYRLIGAITIALSGAIFAQPIEKSCYITFTDDDPISTIKESFIKTLQNNTIAIASPYVLKELLKNPLLIYRFTIFMNKTRDLGVVFPGSITIKEFYSNYGFKNLEHIQISDAFKTLSELKQEPWKTEAIEHLKEIVDIDSDKHPTRFILEGHGTTGMLIANIPIAAFASFINLLSEIKTEFLYINSCYVGGANLLEIQKQIQKNIEESKSANLRSLLATQEYQEEFALRKPPEGAKHEMKEPILSRESEIQLSRKLKSTTIDYYIVLQATNEFATSVAPNAYILFKQLDSYLKTGIGKKETTSIDDIIKNSLPYDASAFASLRAPSANAFFRPVDLGNMQIITWLKLQKIKIEHSNEIMQLKKYLGVLKETKAYKIGPAQAEIQAVIDETERSLQELLQQKGLILPIHGCTQYVQIFPCDMLDVTFTSNRHVGRVMPAFISKIPGNGFHCINRLVCIIDDTFTIKKFIEDTFVNVIDSKSHSNANKCWLINELILQYGEKVINLKKLVILVKASDHNIYVFGTGGISANPFECLYFKDGQLYHSGNYPEKYEYTEARKVNVSKDEQNAFFKSKTREWLSLSWPSEKALRESSGGNENAETIQKAVDNYLAN